MLYTAKGTAALLVPLANACERGQGDWHTVFWMGALANVVAALLAVLVLRPMRQRTAPRADLNGSSSMPDIRRKFVLERIFISRRGLFYRPKPIADPSNDRVQPWFANFSPPPLLVPLLMAPLCASAAPPLSPDTGRLTRARRRWCGDLRPGDGPVHGGIYREECHGQPVAVPGPQGREREAWRAAMSTAAARACMKAGRLLDLHAGPPGSRPGDVGANPSKPRL